MTFPYHNAWLANLLITFMAVGFGLSGDYGNADQGSFLLPASEAFFIWAPIYLSAMAFAIWQAGRRRREHKVLIALGYTPAVSYALACLWSRVDQVGNFELSAAIMAATLVSIGFMLVRLARFPVAKSTQEHWFLDFPLTLFAGWIVVAASVNLTQHMLQHGKAVAVSHPDLWAVAMLLLVASVGWFGSRYQRLRPGLAVAIGWGLAWVAIEQFPHSALIGVVASIAAAETVFAGIVRWHPLQIPGRNEERLA
jgi:FtsH-binding integral membrane protein